MKVQDFIKVTNAEFFTGVPDSQLKALCNYLISQYGTDGARHLIAANEGNATAIAAGYYLATGKVPLVYMQNSGEGNIINPVASLCNEEVYGIPMIFIIGWRGEPGVHDEPQHIFQGKITTKLLDDLDIAHFILDSNTTLKDIQTQMSHFQTLLAAGKQVAFVIRKGALEFDEQVEYRNDNLLLREEVIEEITTISQDDIIISTTGKASRELFEIRERHHQDHSRDFLTVGSMGYSSSIALGVALQKPDRKVWIIDGDGAALMHLGSMAIIGAESPHNLIHIVINNGAHESVGGQPTAASKTDLPAIARGCGYSNIISVATRKDLTQALQSTCSSGQLTFIEVKCAIGSRPDLGRPTTTAQENKSSFMQFLAQ